MAKSSAEKSVTKSKVQIRISTRALSGLLILLAVVLFAGSGWAWWHYVWSSPRNVFERMLDTSLSTTSVVKDVKQADESQGVTETDEIQTSPNHLVRSLSTLTQSGEGGATVKTESIGASDADYARYISIETNQKTADGKAQDFSSVLNIWSKTNPEDTGSTEGQILTEATLGIIPLGKINAGVRQKLIKQAFKTGAYQIDYSKMKRSVVNGRPVYTYQVVINAEPYVAMLKEFAAQIGSDRLVTVDPSGYKSSPAVEAEITVDVRSGHLLKVSYANGQREESYSAYGLQRPKIEIPKDTVGVSEIQAKLQAIQ